MSDVPTAAVEADVLTALEAMYGSEGAVDLLGDYRNSLTPGDVPAWQGDRERIAAVRALCETAPNRGVMVDGQAILAALGDGRKHAAPPPVDCLCSHETDTDMLGRSSTYLYRDPTCPIHGKAGAGVR